jgi:hypothetical protein
MKHKLLLISILAILLLTTVSAGYAYMAGYSLPWWTVDGGGGTSTSAQYSLSGTIGQADAGRLIGGNYILAGGFWVGAGPMGSQLYLPVITR